MTRAAPPDTERVAAGTVLSGRAMLWVLLGIAVLVQLVVLYSPSSPGEQPFPHSDKVVHLLVFLVPVTVALLAGAARWLVVVAFGAHAVVSEVIQALLLPTRSGNVADAVVDLVGVALGVVLWRALVRRGAVLPDA
jgi:VanZ family protein